MSKRFAHNTHLWLGTQLFEVVEGPKNLEVGESHYFDLAPRSLGEGVLLHIDHPFDTIIASVCEGGIHVLSGDLWKVTGRRPPAINKGDQALLSLHNYILPHTHTNNQADRSVYPAILLSRIGGNALQLNNGDAAHTDSYTATPVVTAQTIIEASPPSLSALESPLIDYPEQNILRT